LEQQLSGQSVMVPQGGDILVANGQIDSLRNGGGHCSCELEMAKEPPATAIPAQATAPMATAPQPPASDGGNTEVAALRPAPPPVEPAPVGEQPVEKLAAKDGPAFQVSLPPLRYDATAAMQPE